MASGKGGVQKFGMDGIGARLGQKYASLIGARGCSKSFVRDIALTCHSGSRLVGREKWQDRNWQYSVSAVLEAFI